MFKQTILSSAIMTALSAIALPAFAAEIEEDVEVISVTGIRGSLIKSMDVKRDSTGIVDAISAEDMGKFPDTNLAESLQRITGVSIDRQNGEGSSVTVRGFGSNLITLNGRQLPTTTGSRSFDFANIASESVSGVEVYKTSNATVTSGGIGATINLSTHKPLQAPGTKASIGVKMVNDTSTDKGSATPEFSGLYSQTFADDTFGISISGSRQERESGMQQFLQDQGYRASVASQVTSPSVPAGAAGGKNRDQITGILSTPQQPRYVFEERQRTRTNGQLVLQFKPTDNITTTLDYTMIKNHIEEQHTDASVWFNYSDDRSETVWDGVENGVPLIYSEIYPSVADTSLTVGAWGRKESTDSIGLNIEWQVTEDLTLALDHHSSEAEMKASDPRHGTRNNIQLPSYTRTRTGLDLTGSLPGIATGDIEKFNPQSMRLSGSWFANDFYTSDVSQTQLSGKLLFGESSSIDFGASINTVDNRYRHTQVQRNDWGGVGADGLQDGITGDFEGIDWVEDTILDKFEATPGNFEGTATQSEYDLFDKIFFADFDTIVAAAELADPEASVGNLWGDCKAATGAAAGPNGEGQFCASTNWNADTNRYTEEETKAIYVQLNHEGDLGDMTFDAHLGLRYEMTDVYSESYAPSYNKVIWPEDTQTTVTGVTGIVALDRSGDYSKLLPNLNLNLNLTDDITARFAIGKTIARAAYNQLLGGTTINTSGSLNGYSGQSGNPGLEPLESFNIDLSLEWYYAEGSYASVGYFSKSVSNSIITGTSKEAIFNLPNPLDGEKYDAARSALGNSASNKDLRNYIFENYADDPNVTPNFNDAGELDGGVIVGDNTDRTIMFDINIPINNSEDEKTTGMEFNIQHIFGDSGFGAIANYTYVDSGNGYDKLALTDSQAVIGMSDTANLVAFYDQDGFQARLAYNWRDEFLNERRTGGNTTAPIYTKAYAQLDFNVSYEVPSVEGLTVFVEGINLTDEYVTEYGRDSRLIYKLTQQGARYNLGARYKF